MTRKFIYALAICFAIVLSGCDYNSMVSEQESVDQAWSEVENQYQRRFDLIPNLVNTVKGYAQHEKSTFESVTNARTKAASININAEDLTEENLAKFQEAQNQLGSSLSRLLAVAEAYPELKANENFRDLQTQLEGTENRIAVARRNFNEAAQQYNKLIKSFPVLIEAKIFGFKEKPYFKAQAGAENAVQVAF